MPEARQQEQNLKEGKMFNPYTIRKYLALILLPLFSVSGLIIGVKTSGNLWAGIGISCFVMMIFIIVANLLLKNPFSDVLEGKGILALNMDSTGLLQFFIMAVNKPYVHGNLNGVPIEELFDRDAVFNLKVPELSDNSAQETGLPVIKEIEGRKYVEVLEDMVQIIRTKAGKPLYLSPRSMLKDVKVIEGRKYASLKKSSLKFISDGKQSKWGVMESAPPLSIKMIDDAEYVEIEKQAIAKVDKGLRLELTERDFNKARFGLMQYPVLIWNSQLRQLLFKDDLSRLEAQYFAHGLAYLHQKTGDLSNHIRDFGRYIVEMTKPAKGLLQSWWFRIVIIVAIGILVALFAPSVIQTFKGTAGAAAGSAVKAVGNTAAVLPR